MQCAQQSLAYTDPRENQLMQSFQVSQNFSRLIRFFFLLAVVPRAAYFKLTIDGFK
jgi:hypothetical protein